MAKLQLESTPCFVHSEIQTNIIPEVPYSFPFSRDLLDSFTENCPVVVGTEFGQEESQDQRNITGMLGDTAVGLRRLSPSHGRSYELFIGDPSNSTDAQVIWGDEHGNRFSSLSTKGNNFSSPSVVESVTAPSGYMPYGLLETDSLLRVIRASEIMRQAEIDTEMIVRVLEPKFLRYPTSDDEASNIDTSVEGLYVTVPEFKRRLLMDHWKTIADRTDAIDEFEKVTKAIEQMSFFITVRAMDIGTRVNDVVFCNRENRRKGIEKTFKIFNLYQGIDQSEMKPLVADDPESQERFFRGILPASIGYNLGKLHGLGLAHTYPGFGNVTALGGLVDLDSVRGASLGLGDPEMSEEDYTKDRLSHSAASSMETFYMLFHLTSMHRITPGQIVHKFDDSILRGPATYEKNFIHNYVNARFGLRGETKPDVFLKKCRSIKALSQISDPVVLFPKIEGILATELDSKEFPELVEEETISKITSMNLEWAKEHAADIMATDVQNSLANFSGIESQDELGKILMKIHAAHKLERNLDAKILLDLDQKYFSRNAWKKQLSSWVKNHKFNQSEWQDEVICELLTIRAQEIAYDKIAESCIDALTECIDNFDHYSIEYPTLVP